MLGTTVIGGMHENKFQDDVLMEFSVTVLGGFAMTFFFPTSCTLVLDFFQCFVRLPVILLSKLPSLRG